MSSLPQEHWDYELGRVYSATEFERLVEFRLSHRRRLRQAKRRLWRRVGLMLVLVGVLFALLVGLKLSNFLKERELSRLTSSTEKLRSDLAEQAFIALDMERKLLFAPQSASRLGLRQGEGQRLTLAEEPGELASLDLVELVYPGMGRRARP